MDGLGMLFGADVGTEQICRRCRIAFTLLAGWGWSTCPIDGSRLDRVDDLHREQRLSPTARRSRSSRMMSRRVHGRLSLATRLAQEL